MCGSTARAAYTCAITFTSQLRDHSSSAASTPPFAPTPALEQNRSMAPHFFITCSTSWTTSASRVTLAAMALPPISLAAARDHNYSVLYLHEATLARCLSVCRGGGRSKHSHGGPPIILEGALTP